MSEGVEEKTYIAESLDFINSYKDNFSPLLASIAKTLNNNSKESKALLATMEIMTTTQNSNLKELIVKLKEMKNIGDKSRPINHNGDYSKYVEQCLRLIQLQHSKRQRHDLFISVMRDMKANHELMAQLETLKASLDWNKKASTDWKKMVGMLIPEGANVKILTNVIEPSTWLEISNKFTAVSGKEITGTVVKRAKLNGRVYGGEFKKVVKLQEDLIRNKGDNNFEFSPEHIQLIETEAAVPVVTENFVSSPGTGASGPPVGTGTAVEKGKGTVGEAVEEGTEAATGTLAETGSPAEPAEAEPAEGAETVAATGEAGAAETVAAVVAASATETGSPVTPSESGATGEATETVTPAQLELQLQKGGSQRITRKHKNSIIGTARKSRTNR